MPFVYPKDPDGCPVTLFEYKGYLTGTRCDPTGILDDLDNFEARNDDVMICGYPKSGCHWIWEISCMLLRQEATYSESNKETTMLEDVQREQLDATPSPRVLNCHLPFRLLPRSFKINKCKIVYTLRNPKDVSVSLYHHVYNLICFNYNGKWSGFVHLFLEGLVESGNWFDYVLQWEKDILENSDHPIFVTEYEEFKKEPDKSVKALAAFLGVPCSDDLSASIVDKSSFDKMKVAKTSVNDKENSWRDGASKMYRKGKVGDWKNWYTVADNDLFERVYQKKMKNTQLKFINEL